MKDKKKKRKRGFTLIELLAVIIILGILLVIAIPSVTKYITGSRKSSYISSAKSIISGVGTLANSETLDMKSEDTTYYIPAKYIKTENNNKSPYGEFTEAYVGVILNDKGYRYYWISNDTSKQGIKLITEKDKLDNDLIEKDLIDEEIRETVETTGIEDRKKILILNLDGTWQEERVATHNINEDGELEPTDTLLAIFLPGEEFNIKTKSLAGKSNPDYTTIDTNILHIKRSKEEPSDNNKQEQNIVSTTNSEVPIYAWFDNGTLYWWSEDVKPNLNQNASKMFYYFQGIQSLDFKYIKTNLTTDFSDFLAFCTGLKSLDVSKFDTRNAVNMDDMFWQTSSLERLDVSSFNTSKVTSMTGTFGNMEKLKSLNLKNFDTSNVISMAALFQNTYVLEELNISNFNTSKVKSMTWMFNGAKKLKKLDLRNFDTSNVLSFKAMFQYADSLEKIDMTGFNTSNVRDMSWMFGCPDASLEGKLSEIKGLKDFNTEKVTTMRGMFINQRNIRVLDLSSFNTRNVTDMSFMFLANNLETIYASTDFDVSGVTSSNNMFSKSSGSYISSSSIVLRGGRGTAFDSSHVDKEYARLDDPDNNRPGYFTLKNN